MSKGAIARAEAEPALDPWTLLSSVPFPTSQPPRAGASKTVRWIAGCCPGDDRRSQASACLDVVWIHRFSRMPGRVLLSENSACVRIFVATGIIADKQLNEKRAGL